MRSLNFQISIAVVAGMALLSIIPASTQEADWRKELGTLKIGMVAANAPDAAGLAALRRAYSAALSLPVDFFIARDFAMLVDAQASSRVDYAVYSATAYATAVELCECIEPIAATVDIDGAVGVRSILIANTQKANSLSDIPNVVLAVPPADSIPGWQAPLWLLKNNGLALKGDEPFLLNAGSAVDAELAFVSGQASALIGWERVLPDGDGLEQGGTRDRLRRAGVDLGQTEILWRSPTIRFGPHAVLKSLDGNAKTALRQYLINLHGSDPQAYDLLSGGHGGGFTPVGDSEYSGIRQIVQEAAAAQP